MDTHTQNKALKSVARIWSEKTDEDRMEMDRKKVVELKMNEKECLHICSLRKGIYLFREYDVGIHTCIAID